MYRGTGIHVHQQTFADLKIGDTFFDADYGDMIWNGIKWQPNDGKPVKTKSLKYGDLVHYVPFEAAPKSKMENGRIKVVLDNDTNNVRVVYHCDDRWDELVHYTSALTDVKSLRRGWIINPNSNENETFIKE